MHGLWGSYELCWLGWLRVVAWLALPTLFYFSCIIR